MSQDTCYFLNEGVLRSSGYQGIEFFPCGTSTVGTYNASSEVQSCCISGDTCGANSICHWGTENSHPGGGSGYYTGGCTDPLYRNPLCFNPCTTNSVFVVDVIYRAEPGIWSCCNRTANYSGLPNCDEPLDQRSFDIGWTSADFPGPIDGPVSTAITGAFAALTAGLTASSATATTTSTSLAAASTPASFTPTSAPSSQQGGLSTGAKAGIGIGAALGGLLLVGLVVAVAILWKRQAGTKGQQESTNNQTGGYSGTRDDETKYTKVNSGYESRNEQLFPQLSNSRAPVEMSGHREIAELEGAHLR